MHEWNEPGAPHPALSELLPPLSDHEALVEANRCLFCFDAPCTHACPTHIDIPRFIKKIASSNLSGSARTILDANLLGATCARVCPVQELCEGACVLGAEHKPIMIGRLQRYVMDHAYDGRQPVFSVAPPTGKKVAIIGGGAAGLSCAGELAKRGHAVTVYEKRDLAGGLSTYGIIGLREPIPVALAEVEMIRRMGVEFRTGSELCKDLRLADLRSDFDAVFLSFGLNAAVQRLGIPGEEDIIDGLSYIEQSKVDPQSLKVGASVIVVGAGNTAIDCATVAKRLGAKQVTILYRRTENEVSAYRHEMEFIRNEGVEFRFLTQPSSVVTRDGHVAGMECIRMALGAPDATGRPTPQPVLGSKFFIAADQIVKAIGQQRPPITGALGLTTKDGYIEVNAAFETNIPNVFAGGDCIRSRGTCSTVMAVQDGKLAALSIHERLAARVAGGV
ncbi:MAG: NAD(P)-dependent oxidoreductase [Acidobacteriaceae bacterium]|nr:NAD(P)-dependent oxidoreductase [Acidobacteriaceae bacterium]